MAPVFLENVSFSFRAPIFDNVSLTFPTGWTGVVGANGSGKTTLLRLLAGELEPHAGRVHVPKGHRVLWCKQQSLEQHAELERFAADDSPGARRWRGRFELCAEQLACFEALSSGERKRWQLALALASDPDVLLLDEPTNHLDAEARQLTLEALRDFGGIGVLVSHDRALLDALTTRTVRFGPRGPELLPGNYGAALAEWEQARATHLEAKAQLAREQRRVRQSAARQRQKSEAAHAARSARRRMKDENDNDGRSILSKNKAEFAARRLGRASAALESRLGRIEDELDGLWIEKPLGRELFPAYVPWPKPLLLRAELDALYGGERRLLGRVRLDIARHDKVVLSGPNGAGKSCLLREIERQNPLAFSRSVYLPQRLPRAAPEVLRERLTALGSEARGRVLQLVAALGSGPAAILGSERWSPGETRKVALALGLAEDAPALILDEPDNHFDLPSVERLERLIAAFPGAVLLITHDATFGARVATRWLSIAEGELTEQRLEVTHGAAGGRCGTPKERD